MSASELRYVRHLSEIGDWEMATRPPCSALLPYVRNYSWYIDRQPQISRRLHLPHSGIVLIIALGTRMRVVDPRNPATAEPLLGTYVAGLFGWQVYTEYVGTSEGIEVRLTPLGAQRLLQVPMDSLTNRAVSLTDILGADARRLEERLLHTPDVASRVDMVEEFILRRMAMAEPAPRAVSWAWQQIHRSPATVDIGRLADATNQTHKRLIAGFREHIGLPPGMVSRIVRFERAVAALERQDGTRLADLAVDNGYFDQAHFNREFRAFAGMTPKAYCARLLPEGGGVSGEE